jgi:hypothetical protein
MRISGCGHLLVSLLTAFLFIFSASIEFTVRHRQTQSMQAHDILANERRIVAHVCEACNHRFASRFAYDQHQHSYCLIGTACYTGDNQHLELLSSQRSNISTAVLRIGHSRSRQSQSPSICRIIIDIPLLNCIVHIILHIYANYVWVPGRSQNPTRDPDITCIIMHFLTIYAGDVQSSIIRIIMRIMRTCKVA